MEEREEVTLKTFNTAKKFAEEIVFPLMKAYQTFKRMADFGCEDLNEAKFLDPDIRDIERFNGLKAMNDTVSGLLTVITSTVSIKGNKLENEKLKELKETCENLSDVFYNQRSDFFRETIINGVGKEVINREFFNKIKKIIDVCYINTETLMTKNKLLFADSADEFTSDEELKRNIRDEYMES